MDAPYEHSTLVIHLEVNGLMCAFYLACYDFLGLGFLDQV